MSFTWNRKSFFLILKRSIQLCDILEIIKWWNLKRLQIEGVVFDIEVVVSYTVNAFESEMAQIKDVNLIILVLFIEPQLESAHLYFFFQEMQELLVITYFLCYFWNKTLKFAPNILLYLFVN